MRRVFSGVKMNAARTELITQAGDLLSISQFAQSLPIPLWISGPGGECIFANRAHLEFIGLSLGEALGNGWITRIHPDDREHCAARVQTQVADQKEFRDEARVLRHDGQYRWMLAHMAPRFNQSGECCGFVGTWIDVTEHKLAEAKALHDAMHDSLTSLPNSELFLDRLERSLTRMRREPDHVAAVLYVDLDRLGNVNASFGHAVGDKLVRCVADRLNLTIRPGDSLARMGGDEFAILLEACGTPSDVRGVASRILESVSTPITICGAEIVPTVSIGIAMLHREHRNASDSLRDADRAMQSAKANGKSRVEFSDHPKPRSNASSGWLENDFRRAIQRREFLVHYQPILSVDTGLVEGLEALVRWGHPSQGLMMPAEFIPLAEETGLIVPMERIVLEEACSQFHHWQSMFQAAGERLTLGVNLSVRQFGQNDCVENIMQTLRRTRVMPSSLLLEITESTLISDADRAAEILRRLRDLHIRVALDDFGTGYSSMGYLHRLPVDMIKIDRTFIARVNSGPQDIEIVRAIVAMAHNLRMGVIAEGIETREQLAVVRGLACDHGQGYLFAKPMDAAAMTIYLREHLASRTNSIRLSA